MVNLKKLLTKLCDKVTTRTTAVTLTGRTGQAYFRRFGDIVVCWSSGDFTSLAAQEVVPLGTIPEGFRPVVKMEVGVTNEFTHNIVITFLADGTIRTYNRGSAITSATNGAFFAVWTTV